MSISRPENITVFLVPMNGGIWTLCVSLTGELLWDGVMPPNEMLLHFCGPERRDFLGLRCLESRS